MYSYAMKEHKTYFSYVESPRFVVSKRFQKHDFICVRFEAFRATECN